MSLSPAVQPETSSAVPVGEPITFDDYISRDDDRKADLIDGHLIDDMPTYQHEDIFLFLVFLMRGFAKKRNLGVVLGSRTPIRIDGRNGVEPDILFVQKDRRDVIERLHLSAAPDIAVEIVSPTSTRRDYVRKRAAYEQMGVAEYWLIDPQENEALFLRLTPGGVYRDATPPHGERFESHVLYGFSLDPAILFADELPNEYDLLTEMLNELS